MGRRFIRRRFCRITFDAPARLYNEHQDSWECHITDISLNGVLISRPKDWPGSVNQDYSLVIALPDSDVQLELSLTVAHINEDTIGFRCVSMSAESRGHLQRLVELNLGDPELLYRELAELLA